MLQSGKMHALHAIGPGRCREAICRLGFRARWIFVCAGIVDNGPQPRTNLLQQRHEVGFVEIVCEAIEFQRVIARDVIQEIEQKLVGLKAQPLVNIALQFRKGETFVCIDRDNIFVIPIFVGVGLR